MKRYLFLLALLLLCSTIFVKCKKEPIDYRLKYVGDYHFDIHYTGWTINTGSKDTLYSYEGNISTCSDDSLICIKYSNDPGTDVILNEDGTFHFVPNNQYSYFSGKFESIKSIKFSFGWQAGGGYSNTDITGNR
jgi:hypothetical protein